MRRLSITILLLGLALGQVHADEATKLKLQDPRYAESVPLSTLKIAADARSSAYVPDYPILQEEKTERAHSPYWWAAAAIAVLGLGLGGGYIRARRKGVSGE